MLWWAASVYLVKEVATPHSGMRRHGSNMMGGDWHFWVLVETWNIDSLSGKGEKVRERG